MANNDSPASAAKQVEPAGIGGWLVLPPVVVSLRSLGEALGAGKASVRLIGEPYRVWAESSIAENVYVISFTAFMFAIAIVGAWSLIAFFRLKAHAPRLMEIFFVLITFESLWNLIAAITLFHSGADRETTTAIFGIAESLIPAAIWIAYLRLSVRVKNTFVR